MPLKQIANIVKRTWGDEELTMALLIDELTSGTTTSTTPSTSCTTPATTSTTTIEKEANHKDEGREKEAREKSEEADHMADDFALALRLQQEWEEEEKREKGGPPSSAMPEGSTESDGVYECSICMNDDCTLAEIFIVRN